MNEVKSMECPNCRRVFRFIPPGTEFAHIQQPALELKIDEEPTLVFDTGMKFHGYRILIEPVDTQDTYRTLRAADHLKHRLMEGMS